MSSVLVSVSNGTHQLYDLSSRTLLSSYRDTNPATLRCVTPVSAEVCRGTPPMPYTFVSGHSGAASLSQFIWGQETPLYRCAVSESLSSLVSSRDGTLLAGGGASGRVYLWDSATGELLREWQAHYKAVSTLAFTACASLLASGGLDSVVHCWDVGSLLDVSSGLPTTSSVGIGIGSGSGSGAGAPPPSPVASWSGHAQAVSHVCFTPHSGLCGGPAASRLVSASLDRTVRWWDVASRRCLHTITLPTGVSCLASDVTGGAWYAGGLDGVVYVLGVGGERGGGASSCSGSGSGSGGSSGSGSGSNWSAFSGFHTAAVTSLAVSPDASVVVSGGDDGAVRLWSVGSGQQVGALSSPVNAVAGGGSGGAAAPPPGGGNPSSSARPSISSVSIMPVKPPGVGGAGRGSGSGSGSGHPHHHHLAASLPTPVPLKKHALFGGLGGGSGSGGGGGGGGGGGEGPGKVSILRLLAVAPGEVRDEEGGQAIQYALFNAPAATVPVGVVPAGGVDARGVPPPARGDGGGDNEEMAALRERVQVLEGENARWKAVAGKLLEKQKGGQ
jgi:WD40 repeat protein